MTGRRGGWENGFGPYDGETGHGGTAGDLGGARRRGSERDSRFYWEMLIGGLVAGVLSCIIVQALFQRFYLSWPNLALVGAGFAATAFLLVLCCGVVEAFQMGISDNPSVRRTLVFAFAGAAAIGCAAVLFEFLYELGFAQTGVNYDDYIFVVDDSGSMADNDPRDQRYSAMNQMLDRMDETNQVGLIRFSDMVEAEVPLLTMDGGQTDRFRTAIEKTAASGGTDISLGLQRAYEMYHSGRRGGYLSTVVLLSDGQSVVDTNSTIRMFNEIDVDICTVALGMGADRDMLETLAQGTGGMALEISNADAIRSSYALLSGASLKRCLLQPRFGADKGDILHAVMCVVFLTLLGVGMMLVLQLMFNSRYMKPQLLVGPAASLVGALALEAGHDLGAGGGMRIILLMLDCLVLIHCAARRQSEPVHEHEIHRSGPAVPGTGDPLDTRVLTREDSGVGAGRSRSRR